VNVRRRVEARPLSVRVCTQAMPVARFETIQLRGRSVSLAN
jgi:hypothetical protein